MDRIVELTGQAGSSLTDHQSYARSDGEWTKAGVPMALTTSTNHPLLHLLREQPALRGFIAIRCADELAVQMLNVAVGWYVYTATGSPMSLAYVGLAQFLPNIGLVLVAGQVADRFDRRKVIALALLVEALCIAAFGAWSVVAAAPAAWPVYLLLLIIGTARAFYSPAMSALLPHVVSAEDFPRAVATVSSAFQVSSLAGPAVGGLVYAANGPILFAMVAGLFCFAMAQARRLPRGGRAPDEAKSELTDESVFAGVRYVRSNRLLLGLISLDLFAVLLGGVTALLPIYAKDILAVGPIGLGWLRCAPGVGAAIVGVALAHRTIGRGAGRLMLACVAGFGLATVVFALSESFWLSLAALAAAGGFDMVSMVIRHTLVQVATPDAVRGRVSAVNGVFVGASGELGEFESGATAALFGTVPAAVLGGVGTLAVVALWAWLFPELRRVEKLVTVKANEA
jgi:MFS family permease